MPADAQHLLVLQDDAVPCESFHARTTTAIAAKPDDLLCLFAPGFGFVRRRMLEAQKTRQPFAPFPQVAFVPLVAVVYPARIVEGLLGWVDGGGWPAGRGHVRGADDGIVALYTRAHRLRVWMTVPCLADHRADIASIAKQRHNAGAHRRAAAL